ncbi:7-cyano-7-deazaguanine synthase, partial [Vibrio anguillarum]|nr:7-cyano-7-deazaguanine synthase [Vibrio anguillarum]
MKEAIVLTSGGLDSTTVVYQLVSQNIRVKPLFFNYGQHCMDTEWERLNDVLPTSLVAEPEKIDISEVFSGSKSRLIKEADLWSEKVIDDDLYIP